VSKASEVHNLEDPQVVELVGRARQELFNLRFQHATGQLENTARLKAAKKELARGLTVARQRGIDTDVELARQKREET
jgi:large subunit ribosomal protein L29